MSLDNYFNRQSTSENEIRAQIAASQTNFTNAEETGFKMRYKTRSKKQQISTKHKSR